MMILQTSRGALSSGGFDRIAARYTKAVEDAGATVTSTQKDALNTFFKTGKSEGWISSLRRMYLPIWGAAAPNAIDMMTVTSGTFVGSVTHGDRFIQSDGVTGYFDTGAIPANIGMDLTAGGSCSVLIRTAHSTSAGVVPIGAVSSSVRRAILTVGDFPSSTLYEASVNVSATFPAWNVRGILMGSVTSNSNRLLKLFKNGNSIAFSSTRTTLNNTLAPDNQPVSVLARNFQGTRDLFFNGRIGMAHLGIGLDSNQMDQLAAAQEALWETSTERTLP